MQILQIDRNTVFKKTPLNSTQLPGAEKLSITKGMTFPIVSAIKQQNNHYLVQLQQDLFPVGKVGYFYAEHVTIKTPIENKPLENRGVWLTNVDSDVLESRNTIEVALKNLVAMGFNTIYPVVWNKGYTLYPSKVAQQASGIKVDPKFQGRDMLAELIEVAKAHGLRVIPWFEYGLKTLPNTELAQNKTDWLLQKADGNPVSKNVVWLNPAHPEVIQFMTNLISEVVRNYDVDGIQLDDHFGTHVELGYDRFTKQLYKQEKGIEPPANHKDVAWMAWRAGKLTQLMQQIFRTVKAVKPGCLISLAPNPLSFAYAEYLTDWANWEREGYIEELIVQLYKHETANVQTLVNELARPEMMAARSHIPVSIGVLSGLKNQAISLNFIQQQIEIIRQAGYAGVSFFFYETVVHQMLTGQGKQIGDRDPVRFKSLFA